MQIPLLHTHPSSLLRGSPEPGGDLLSRTQAKTGFLQGTGAGHQLLKTLEPPQNCLTQSHPGRRANLRTTATKLGAGCPDTPPPGGIPDRPLDLLGGLHCRKGCWGLPGPPRSPATHEGRQAVRREAGAPKLRGVGHTVGGAAVRWDRPLNCPRPQSPAHHATH